MKTLFLFVLLLVLGTTGTMLGRSSQWSVNKDAKGNLYYRQTLTSDRYAKEVLYSKTKEWMITQLDASDNWMQDEGDSLRTAAYVSLGNGPTMLNQFVSMVVTAYIKDQTVEVTATGLVYHATPVATNEPEDLPLSRLLDATEPELRTTWQNFDGQMQRINRSLQLYVMR